MKKVLFFAALVLSDQPLWARSAPRWDSTFRPASYALKAELFRSFPNSKKDVIIPDALIVENYRQIVRRIQQGSPRTLQVVNQKHPDLKTSLLSDKRTLDEQLQELGYVPFVCRPHHSFVTPGLVAACHQKGMKVVPRTINDREGIERARAAGVDGIISDYPNLFEE